MSKEEEREKEGMLINEKLREPAASKQLSPEILNMQNPKRTEITYKLSIPARSTRIGRIKVQADIMGGESEIDMIVEVDIME
ncbi:hypothetical protein EUZ85_02280 [Hahella sp. KA22]|uniref:hypothetical protein n=1 Tax=Hahella sp. KA22 TaxID=1628392 RepID=UPI000FDE9DA2|nr:hypothetical protein [Hahella sp. KA22]AZZ95321.1 hypothetical protein ENC22_30570 [Hahella sp. KA22]QAY52966.1 hypothetical protein EUZ85_02280 [Hahella sp. KA22]